MKDIYRIHGMTCNGCRSHVEETLSKVKGVSEATVNLENAEATIEMEYHISLDRLQEALKNDGGRYSIHKQDEHHQHSEVKKSNQLKGKGTGTFYCPMHCEGDKTYDKPGDCPVCGMDLVEQPKLIQSIQYTCPMHPEIIEDSPSSCSICGMDLVPLAPEETAESKTYNSLLRKMKISLVFAIPVFLISMSMHIPANPLAKLMPQIYWDWLQLFLTVPIVFYTCWMFFERAWKSIITWNLNMFTLVGIGTGAAFLFSIVGLLFPEVFPQEFKGPSGDVSLYFEATAVILTLVLLGQLLEARAHSQTSGAIKELRDVLLYFRCSIT